MEKKNVYSILQFQAYEFKPTPACSHIFIVLTVLIIECWIYDTMTFNFGKLIMIYE